MHTHLAGPGFRHRLLTNLQDLARRSLLHIKCSLHLTLQSQFPRKDFPDNPGTQAGSKVKPPVDRQSSSKQGIKAVDL
jgi:hypothetical protein